MKNTNDTINFIRDSGRNFSENFGWEWEPVRRHEIFSLNCSQNDNLGMTPKGDEDANKSVLAFF